MRSSLSRTAVQSAIQRRNQSQGDGWAGEETEKLVTLDSALAVRAEWAEGVSPSWDFWIFKEEADIQVGDVLIVESIGIGVTVTRISTWPDLRGVFHHYEANTTEHELSVAELLV
jgi:hypothetical protein